MNRERKRIRDKPKKKGIPLADIGSDVIWDDPKLKVPFSSNPYISRMKGSAVLNMALSFGLYYNELTGKWSPITSATMTESLIKARYYASTPDVLTELSDNPLRSTNSQELMVKDTVLENILNKLKYLETTKLSVKDDSLNTLITTIDTVLDAVKVQTDKLQFDVSNNLKCFYNL